MEWRDLAYRTRRTGVDDALLSATHYGSRLPVSSYAKYQHANRVNQLPSGFTIRMADMGAQKVQWRLRYSSLTDAERSSIESLFEASEGQLNTFTFLDPTDNLLMWSEDWTQAVWTAESAIASDRRSAGSTRWQRRDATHEHRANDTTDRSEHERRKFVSVLLQRVCQEQRACDNSVGCDRDRTDLSDGDNDRHCVDAGDSIGKPFGSTGRYWIRRAIAGGRCKWKRSALKWRRSPRRDCIRRRSTSAASIRARGFLPTYSPFTATAPIRTPVRSI